MYLKNISLHNFKNYLHYNTDFVAHFNLICGLNGVGKTNLLDAIYYLSFGKSAFVSDNALAKWESSFFRVEGNFLRQDEPIEIVVKWVNNQRKEIIKNGLSYDRFSEHVGELPLSLIAPNDIDMVQGGGENRRKLMDMHLSQIEPDYLQALLRYNRALLQRNTMLKQYQDVPKVDLNLLQAYDFELHQQAHIIFEKRKTLSAEIVPLVNDFYAQLSQGREDIGIRYSSALTNRQLLDILVYNLPYDRQMARTTEGTHRDDWELELKGMSLKKFGSQGQQKSFVLALKLALAQYVSQKKGIKPLLLLDDIFDKLDNLRIEALIELVQAHFSQVFITDTQPERLTSLFKQKKIDFKLIHLEE
ncbi:MAG: DNA replication and repair protein RecF [Chitinophagales bacterium]|nr:DNA replication and repair protein RecF [Bacteroidota bacterium]